MKLKGHVPPFARPHKSLALMAPRELSAGEECLELESDICEVKGER